MKPSIEAQISRLKASMENEGIEDVNIVIAKNKNFVKPNMGFNMVFNAVLLQAINKYDITMAEFKTLLVITDVTAFRNALSITQATIAKILGVKTPMINRHFKKFYEIGILFKDTEGSIWVNPAIFAKGNLWDFKENEELYRHAEIISNNLGLEEPPF